MWILQESKFLKSKDTVDLCRVNFDINILFIQYNRCSCCKHITSGFNTYLYGCVSLLNNLYVVYLCVCVISNGSTCKKPHYFSDLAKLDTQQEQCGWKKKKCTGIFSFNTYYFMKSLYPTYAFFQTLFNSLNLQHRGLEPSVNYDLGLSGEILSLTASIDL